MEYRQASHSFVDQWSSGQYQLRGRACPGHPGGLVSGAGRRNRVRRCTVWRRKPGRQTADYFSAFGWADPGLLLSQALCAAWLFVLEDRAALSIWTWTQLHYV